MMEDNKKTTDVQPEVSQESTENKADQTPERGATDKTDPIIKGEQEGTGYDPDTLTSPEANATDEADEADKAQVATAAEPTNAADIPADPSSDHTLSSDTTQPDLDESRSDEPRMDMPGLDEPGQDQADAGEQTAGDSSPEHASGTNSAKADSTHHDDEDEHDDDEDHEEIDYHGMSKEELVKHAEELLKVGDVRKADRQLNEIKPHYEELHTAERQTALEEFLKEEGADEADFDYRGDNLDTRYDFVYRKIKEERQRQYHDQQKQREDNLKKKNELLAKLREFVDSEEGDTSLGSLKQLQENWKKIGPVPAQYNSNLWANYNALLDRFYNNRTILYELKELDRRKNLEAKQEIVDRAQALLDRDNLKQATRELRELHEEFKHIGPVPKEEQEPLWQRFKELSDKVYDKRREHLKTLNEELEANLVKKRDLGDKVQAFLEFSSDRITEWNDKTKELLHIQKEWDSIGGLPRQVAKEVNKFFWNAFKGFFNNKNKFFKTLEQQREENLKRKEELVAEAQALQESEDWQNTANKFKQLQTRWKEIGPVPEKQRDDVYKRFKAAADEFFNRKRAQRKEANVEQDDNLQKKMEVIGKINKMAEEKSQDIDTFHDLQDEYDNYGFVPRGAISKVRNAYSEANKKFIDNLDMPEEEKEKLILQSQISRIKSTPDSGRKLRQKENNIRRQISKVENDIATWQNNLEFFASSKNADKLKDSFAGKIEEAKEQLSQLKEQLKIVQENE
jgi:hypothetical protein